MRRPGEVLSRYQLLELAWDRGYENRSNVIDVLVGRLLAQIGSSSTERCARADLTAAG
jgi:two-component system, OmpR family, response regulator